jgi:hypothetical protein
VEEVYNKRAIENKEIKRTQIAERQVWVLYVTMFIINFLIVAINKK